MKKIMIADDSLMIRMTLKRIFQQNGYEVVAEAANGQEAVDKYLSAKPDLVTLDITMPILDGISALKEIRSLNEDAVVIMISALGQETKILEAFDNGASHYITKPFSENEIVSRLKLLA
ncbi:MAG: response regulator receiver protein [Clostridiales bacterium]|jgi:two-component system chemotaxis response regulator CheY|nr:response regulator receiver protein [Clostridiales bacterium]